MSTPQFPTVSGILTPDQRVRVFISSTLGELRAERTAVGKIVKDDLDLYPVMFEAGASPHPPRERYRAMLLQSHIYIGIFWESYGWVAPDMDISGMEDEYNHSNGMTRLIYIKSPAPEREERLQHLLKRMENESTFCYKRFETVEELCRLVKGDIQLVLSESFLLGETTSYPDASILNEAQTSPNPPLYLTALQAEIDARPRIGREALIQSIEAQLEQNSRMVLIGDPGVGKTFLLGELGRQHDAIYVSLRGKTTQQVFSHLTNHLRLRRGELSRLIPSEEESRAWLESELSQVTAPMLFLLDHADQNPTTARALSELEVFTNQFLFASRPTHLSELQGVTPFEVPSFSRDQIAEFLVARGLQLAPGEAEKLTAASRGNALYLDFFARHQINPLPQGLNEYQGALWDQLSTAQQELAALVAHSLVPLGTADLHALVANEGTLAQTARKLQSIEPLLHLVNRRWEVFHPYFQEHILSEYENLGMSTHVHQLLGDYALEKHRIVATAFHLMRAEDERADEYLKYAASVATVQGDWSHAEEFLNRALQLAQEAEDVKDEADVLHGLAQVYGESGRRPKALDTIQKSIALFDQLGEQEARRMVELYAASLWIDDGQSEKAVSTLKSIAAEFHGVDERVEAGALSNLSYAYIQTGLGQEGAEAAERALEIFTRVGDLRGEKGALTNLSACIGMTDSGDLAEQRKWANRVIQRAQDWSDPRLKAAGLNHLARVQRREGDYVGAQKSSEEAIALCQQVGALDAELTNIANLGNAFRDQGKFDQAEGAYNEVLLRTREVGLVRQEAHALELLARLRHDQGLHEQAIELSQSALKVFEHTGDVIRIASAQDKLARAYKSLKQNERSAQAYEASAVAYEKAREWSDAAYGFSQAAALWNACHKSEAASRCALHGARCALKDEDLGGASNALTEVADSNENVGQMYSDLLERFLTDKHPTNFVGFITNFSIFCKNRGEEGRERFKTGIYACVQSLIKEFSVPTANALAIGIEQSSGLLELGDVDEVTALLVEGIAHFHARGGSEEIRSWTVGLETESPLVLQLTTPSDYAVPRQLGVALALIFLSNREGLFETIDEFGKNQEEGMEIQIVTQEELEERDISFSEMPSNPDVCASMAATQTSSVLITHTNYSDRTDWSKHPGNKAFLWVIMILFQNIVAHCSHKSSDDSGFKGKASRFCDRIFK